MHSQHKSRISNRLIYKILKHLNLLRIQSVLLVIKVFSLF